jgi:hypothetical protein
MRSMRWARDGDSAPAKDAEPTASAGTDRPVAGCARGGTGGEATMEDEHFDALARAWGTPTGRRVVMKTWLGRALAALGLTLELGTETAAEQGKHKHSKQQRRESRTRGVMDEKTSQRAGRRRSESGSVHASDVRTAACLPPDAKKCLQASDCCSGRCKKKKKCLGCLKGFEYCPAQEKCVTVGPCVTSCATDTSDCDGDGICETNTANSNQHCGSCGNACGSGKSCQGGQCLSSGGHPCSSQADCGGPPDSSNHIYCDESQHQCRCVTTGYGICLRTSDGRGICGECCDGGAGSLNCQGELGCNGHNFCTCPAGKSECPGGTNRCYQAQPNADGTVDDPTVCINAGGTSCVDCTEGGTKPYVCCWSRTCVDASGRGPNQGGTFGAFCGGCTKCQSNKICCNDGHGGAPSRKDPASGGFCPLPGA